jgi:hypothetical protein
VKRASWTTLPASKNTNSTIRRIQLSPQTRTKTRHATTAIKWVTLPLNVARSNATRLLVSLILLKPRKEKGANLNPKVKAMELKERTNLMTGNPKAPTGATTAKCQPTPQITAAYAYGKGEKGSAPYSKGKGKPSGKGQGWSNSNFPSDYSGTFANAAPDSYSDNTQRDWRSWDTQDTWHKDGDLGFMVLHENEVQGSSDKFSQATSIEQQFGLDEYSIFPTLFQIYVQWEYVSAPFILTVRADMTILDITKTLSALLKINAIFLFLFLDFRMLHSRRRLDETPTITHGATLVLKRWKVDQAIHWSSCYGRLSTEEIKTMYWNFDTSRFQTARPTLTGSLSLPLSSETSSISDMTMMVHDDGDSLNTDFSCTTLQPIPRWVLGRGQLANIL